MSSDLRYQPPGAFITHLIKSGLKRRRAVKANDDFETHYLDLRSLKLDLSAFTPFLISKRLSSYEVISPRELEPVLAGVAEATKKDGGLSILVVGGKLTLDSVTLVKGFRHSNIVIMDKGDIKAISAANEAGKHKLICAVLARFVDRDLLSPYSTGRPASGGRFFARSAFVKRMVRRGNFTIVGNRRIGKTSLLSEVKSELKLENEDYRIAEVYGPSCHSTVEVVYEILERLDLFWAASRVVDFPHAVRNFPDYIHAIADVEKRPVAVFIDELDHILAFDEKQDYELLHLLRATFMTHNSCRIIMAGFRKVIEAIGLLSHPLYNFGDTIELRLFTRDEAYEMITKPLAHLGVDIAANLPEAIYRETGGHPELIQVHCAEIIHYFEETGSVPDPTVHLTRVFESPDYKQKVFGSFLANTNAYEKLICYLLFADGESAAEYEFGLQEVQRVLKEQQRKLPLEKIHAIMTNLKVSGIITPVTGRGFERFKFSVPQLAGYCLSLDLEFCIQDALDNIGDSTEAIWAEAEGQ